MKNIYYTLWADCFIRIKLNPNNRGLWKFNSFIAMNLSMMFNLLVFFAILQRYVLHYNFYDLNLYFIPNDFVRSLLSGLILFFLPPSVLNYLLIFRKNKYIEIEHKYKTYKGNLFLIYLLSSCFGPIVLGLIIYGIEQLFGLQGLQ
jgi:hypothetical protein